MATSNTAAVCYTCKEKTTTYPCLGCSKYFCFDDLAAHRESLKTQFHDIEDQRNGFAQILGDHKTNQNNHSLIEQITQWERTSIKQIKKTAEEQRQLLQKSIYDHTQKVQTKLDLFTEEIQQVAKKKAFDEKALGDLRNKLEDLKKELNQPANIQIKEDSATYIKKLAITITNIQEQSSMYSDKQLECCDCSFNIQFNSG